VIALIKVIIGQMRVSLRTAYLCELVFSFRSTPPDWINALVIVRMDVIFYFPKLICELVNKW